VTQILRDEYSTIYNLYLGINYYVYRASAKHT